MDIKRIAYLVRPAEGGMKTHVLTLMRNLDQSRFEPVLISPPGELANEAGRLGIQVIPLDVEGALNPLKDFSTAMALRKILSELKPDILHIHSAKAGLIGRFAARVKNRPKIVLTYHSFVFDEHTGSLARTLTPRIERFFDKVTDKVIAVSEALKDELVTLMQVKAEKINVIYNGIDFPAILPKKPHPGMRIGTVARLAPQKGVEYFIRAAALVLSRHPDSTFVIAGAGPRRGSLVALSDSLGIREGIDFAGEQSNVPALLATLDIFVLTSTRETFGLALAEAMAQQLPVIATRVGGVPEIVEDGVTGLLVNSEDVPDIADKIRTLIEDIYTAQQLGEAGCESVRARFTVQQMLEKTQAIYEELLAPPARRGLRA